MLQNGSAHLVLVLLIAAAAVIGGFYLLGTPKNTNQSLAVASQLQSSPTPFATDPQMINWQLLEGKFYSLKYPADWVAQEVDDDKLGQAVIITNGDKKSVVLRVLTKKQNFMFAGATSTKISDLKLNIEGQSYDAKEVILGDRIAYIDQNIKKDGQDFEILFGTGYPAAEDSLASISDYKSSKETIIKILTTLKIKEFSSK